MTPKQQIQALESLGITRYRISCDTEIPQMVLSFVARGKQGMGKRNADILDKYYKKVIEKFK